MKVFSDVITGDELASDAYPMQENGPFFEIDGQVITVGGEGADIGGGGEGEEVDDNTEQKINVVHSFNLQPTSFDKKSYMVYLKGYMKAVENHLKESDPARVDGFKAEAQEHVKKVIANFKDYEFFTGESMNPDGQVVLLNYREDGITPYFTLWKDGLKSQKI
ncbi:translationally-controlled tumor protein [Wallemia mellicola CBS 633.66]|uniref:Translationally-controlled tumor protein homolog n=2 Tax=Wallemia mellicola TaxID=1708541 RepID=I4YC60_WALMC|nr:translationally-controlled tumor protein [Wallemia mellicola CBS 633.66]TIB70622.1 hypothetical protein E3Q23_04101 [Wallemia mellicola]EIM21552.1 translationally-controlled tumor protein [Wallemia mellicola CBS 633.66]TIB74528.1 hypothetical protein E3Q24_00494 [Wallemia mellicola]TIB89920.1 translationally-controlled tumor protein [Wallemia mellicola]TIC62120.1 translationally-controlled tumor protein [Wallemia mellicola]|eukprot:XP_006958252.1 translationally-controlled tumor protein [Wallemia mellicola CBS 633.66]